MQTTLISRSVKSSFQAKSRSCVELVIALNLLTLGLACWNCNGHNGWGPLILSDSQTAQASPLFLAQQIADNSTVTVVATSADPSVPPKLSPSDTNPLSIGTFSNGFAAGIGYFEGVILTTGIAISGYPLIPLSGSSPQSYNVLDSLIGSATTEAEISYASKPSSGGDSDNELQSIAPGANLQDICGLEFAFVPSNEQLSLELSFASEEYFDYVFQTFNDTAGIFLQYPGSTSWVNITPLQKLTVDSVNVTQSGSVRSFAYFDNDRRAYYDSFARAPLDNAFDGFAFDLVARAKVFPNLRHKIKIVVGDAGDQSLDSAVWIKKGSLKSSSFPTTSGSLRTEFTSQNGPDNGIIYASAMQIDGKLIIGGSFTTVGGVSKAYLARFNADGTLDANFSFYPGQFINGAVHAIAIQPDSKILIGGAFTTVGGAPRNRFARLQSNGSLDTTLGDRVFNGIVRAIVLRPQGGFIVGGDFVNNQPYAPNYISKYGSSGSLESWGAANFGPNGPVSVITIYDQNKVLVGGNFNSFNGDFASNLVLMNNSTGELEPFNNQSGPNGAVSAIRIQDNGQILVAGAFTAFGVATPNQVSISNLARLDPSGELDASFQPEAVGTPNSWTIRSILPLADNSLVIGGDFTTYGSSTVNRMTRVLANGKRDPNFAAGLSGANGSVYTLELSRDRSVIWVGGGFTLYNAATKKRIAPININQVVNYGGKRDTRFQASVVGTVFVTAEQPDGKVLIGGSFTSVNGQNRANLARLNPDGTLDNSWIGLQPNGPVYALAVRADRKIMVGGAFTTITQITANDRYYLARLNEDGSLEDFPQVDLRGPVRTIALSPITAANFQVGDYNPQKLMLGGEFNDGVSSSLQGYLSVWDNFGNNLGVEVLADAPILTICNFDNNESVLVGGSFTNFKGQPKPRIVKTDFELMTATDFNPGSGANGSILTIARQVSEGVNAYLVGGAFTTFNNQPRQRLARISASGNLDSSFQVASGSGANGSVCSIAVGTFGPDDSIGIAVGGSFTSFNSMSINRIARLDAAGNLDNRFVGGSGFNSDVKHIVRSQRGANLIIGGGFSTYAGSPSSAVAKVFGQ